MNKQGATLNGRAPIFQCDALVNGKIEEQKPFAVGDGKYKVLFFYPADFTFICPTEINGFSDRYDEFLELGCEVYGLSTDNVHSHRAWADKPRKEGGIEGLRFPLFGDHFKRTAAMYNALGSNGLATRTTYIIDGKGFIQWYSSSTDEIGRNIDEVLRVLRAVQQVEKGEGVCPLGWVPGKATLDPSREGLIEHLAKV
jgi:alkyl hydroperoxide reductase subunit AhpC